MKSNCGKNKTKFTYLSFINFQDQPSSDSFYDSDTDHAEPPVTQHVSKTSESDSHGRYSPEDQDDISSMQDAEVDGEWGMHLLCAYKFCT